MISDGFVLDYELKDFSSITCTGELYGLLWVYWWRMATLQKGLTVAQYNMQYSKD